MNSDNVTQSNSFGVEYILKEIWKFIGDTNTTINVNRIQADNSVMCEYFCIRFIYFMLKGKSLLDYINLISLNIYDESDKIILKYCQ